MKTMSFMYNIRKKVETNVRNLILKNIQIMKQNI